MSTFDVGILTNAPVAFQDTVTTTEPDDVYKFTIKDNETPVNTNIALHDLSGNPINEQLILYKDNGDKKFDRATDKVETIGSFGIDHPINDQLAAGTYFAVVNRTGLTNTASVGYSIDMSTTELQKPSNIIGVNSKFQFDGIHNNFTGGIDNGNTSDMYALHIDKGQKVTLTLDGMTADADLRVVTKSGTIVGDVVASSTHSGNGVESIVLSSNNVLPGDYFVEVYQFSGRTGYNLHADLANV